MQSSMTEETYSLSLGRASRLWLGLLALSLATASTACSNKDDDTTKTPTFTTGTGGSGGAAGAGGSEVTSDGSAGSTSEVDAGTGGSSGSAGSGGTGGSPEVDGGADGPTGEPVDAALDVNSAVCASDGGCWSCPPLQAEHFLNRCTTSQCSPFDDSTRLPSQYRDGGLPTF